MNIARDYANNVDLKLAEWKVIRIWEYEIKTKAKQEEALGHLYAQIIESLNSKYYQIDEIEDNSIAV